MCSEPFAQLDTTAARREFADQVGRIRAARPDVAARVNRHLDVARPDVTDFMLTARESSLKDRRSRYLQDRVLDQLRSYQGKSQQAEKTRNRYLWLVALLAEAVAAVEAAVSREHTMWMARGSRR